MRSISITPVKRYHGVSKQLERLPKRDLQQRNLKMGQLLDTHFPISGLLESGGTRPGRSSVLLTPHMVWTDTEEDEYPVYDWFHDPAVESTFPPEATTAPTASPAPTIHTTIADEPIPISSDETLALTPERRRSISELARLASPLESGSESQSLSFLLANQLSTERLVGSLHNVSVRTTLVK